MNTILKSAFAAAILLCPIASPALADEHSDDGHADNTHAELLFTPSIMPYPFSSAVQAGDVLYLSGELGVADDGKTLVPGGIEPETKAMMARIGATLEAHDLDFSDVFKCTVMLADMADWPAFNAIYRGYFEEGRFPARSAMGVNGLALGAAVEMECTAWRPQ